MYKASNSSRPHQPAYNGAERHQILTSTTTSAHKTAFSHDHLQDSSTSTFEDDSGSHDNHKHCAPSSCASRTTVQDHAIYAADCSPTACCSWTTGGGLFLSCRSSRCDLHRLQHVRSTPSIKGHGHPAVRSLPSIDGVSHQQRHSDDHLLTSFGLSLFPRRGVQQSFSTLLQSGNRSPHRLHWHLAWYWEA